MYYQIINGSELWKSDGTNEGTVLVKDIFPGSGSGSPDFIRNIEDIIYFKANDGIKGTELWRSDGTSNGTFMLKDIFQDSGSSSPAYLSIINGVLYFTADDGINGNELWMSDGTSGGTVLVKDIYPGPISSTPYYMTVRNANLYFSAKVGGRWTNERKIEYTYSYSCSPDKLILPYFREYYYDEFVDITAASFIMHRWDDNIKDWYISYKKDKYFSNIVMLSLSTDSLEFSTSEGGSTTFDIISSTDWTINSDQDWVTLTSSKGTGENMISGTGNATITLNVSSNPTSEKRTAVVTVTGTNVTNRTITVTQEGTPTDVVNFKETPLHVYPNPVTDFLNLPNFNGDLVKVSIYDMSGRIVMEKLINGSQLNLSNLQVGIYTLKIQYGTGTKVLKLIKN